MKTVFVLAQQSLVLTCKIDFTMVTRYLPATRMAERRKQHGEPTWK